MELIETNRAVTIISHIVRAVFSLAGSASEDALIYSLECFHSALLMDSLYLIFVPFLRSHTSPSYSQCVSVKGTL